MVSRSGGSNRGFGSTPAVSRGHQRRSSEGEPLKPSGQRQLYAHQILPLLERGLDQQAEPLLRLMAQSRAPIPEVLRDLARLLERQGAHAEAQTHFLSWLSLPPKASSELLAQALKAEQLQRPQLALERYQSLLKREPDHPQALERASELLMERASYAEALPLLERRLELAVTPALLSQASRCAFELQQGAQAAAWAQQALEQVPDQAELVAIVARHQQHQGMEATALATANRALQLAQGTGGWSLVNRLIAPIMVAQRLLDRATEALREALQAEPSRQELHLQLAETLLLKQQLLEGFQEYQWRPTVQQSSPLPQGSSPHEPPLVLVGEGTLGDTLLFSRYGPWLKRQHGMEVRLSVQLPLLTLLQQALGDTLPVEPANPRQPGSQASVLPLLSAPALFGTCQEHPALASPHLKADPETVAHWRQLLNLAPGERLLGLNWHGLPLHLHSITERHQSNIPLELFEPLTELPKTALISLQKGIGKEQLDTCRFLHRFVRAQDAVTAELRIEQTAALMSLCDWIVTDDSGPAHLAGCLGIPTIVLLPERCNWRWGHAGSQTPWYPHTTLLRQTGGSGWQPLVQKACRIIQKSFQAL